MNKFGRTVSVILVAVLLLFSCGKDDDSAKAQTLSQKQMKSVSYLSYIPADTPYLMASLEPMPEAVFNHYMKLSEELFGVYGNVLTTVYDGYLSESAGEDSTREQREQSARVKLWVEAIKSEFPDGFGVSAIEHMGFSRESLGALYGNGLLPVSRTELVASDKFVGLVERLQKKAEVELASLALDGATGWVIPIEEDGVGVKIVIAVVDSDLVITAMPLSASEQMLRSLVGLTKPEKSLAEVDTLPEIINQKEYLKTMIGMIDFQQLFSRAVDEPQGVDKELFELLEVDRSEYEMSDVCRAEMREVIDVMPRALFGFKELSVQVMEQEWLLEVRSDIAGKMQKIAHPVPGVGDNNGLFSFGMGYNLSEARKFALERIAHLEANPYSCEFLQMDADQLVEARTVLNNPASMMVQGIFGGVFIVEDVDIDKIMKKIEDKKDTDLDPDAAMALFGDSVGFKMAIAAQNAAGLLGMAGMMAPEVLQLGLEANREPVLLNPASPMPLPFDVFAAMGDKAFVLSAGINADNIPSTLFESSEREYPPLLAYSMDGKRYSEILDAVLTHPVVVQSIEEEEDITPEQMRQLMGAMYGVLGQISAEVVLREDGVAITQATRNR